MVTLASRMSFLCKVKTNRSRKRQQARNQGSKKESEQQAWKEEGAMEHAKETTKKGHKKRGRNSVISTLWREAALPAPNSLPHHEVCTLSRCLLSSLPAAKSNCFVEQHCLLNSAVCTHSHNKLNKPYDHGHPPHLSNPILTLANTVNESFPCQNIAKHCKI